MRWATRRGCHVDRAACVWLIKRYLDPEAESYFFGEPTEAPEGAELFDVAGERLSHHGDDCSFETFLKEYGLTDPILTESPRSCTTRILWTRSTGVSSRRVSMR